MSKEKVENEIQAICDEATGTNVVPYIFSLDKIEKPNCKLCQSDFREKAENIFDNQKRTNYAAIQRLLKDEDDFDISATAVRNHILYHYKAVEDNASLQDYADDIQKWVGMQSNKVASIKTRIALLERYMFMISQESEDLDIIEKRKSAETVKKLVETILTCEKTLKEFKEEASPVSLVFNQLQIIVKDELKHIENSKTKKVLSTVLDRLKDTVGDMIVED